MSTACQISVCGSIVRDPLRTLEPIAFRAGHGWIALGGELTKWSLKSERMYVRGQQNKINPNPSMKTKAELIRTCLLVAALFQAVTSGAQSPTFTNSTYTVEVGRLIPRQQISMAMANWI